MSRVIALAERRLLPDAAIRFGIRRLLSARRRDLRLASADADDAVRRLVHEMDAGPIAAATRQANEQHYEVPASFFRQVLGPYVKYSCSYWDEGTTDLRDAERTMLELSCHRAGVVDGMRVLDLGCGWGSMSLWLAERYPRCRITAVSNSLDQRRFITSRCREQGLSNVTVVTADMNDFAPRGLFDRVVSIEMFEHMRNYGELLSRVARWLSPGGRLFVQVFCHRSHPYLFRLEGPGDWMARHFFTGGLMPSPDLWRHFERYLRVEHQWIVNGRHYARTADAWLHRLDAGEDRCLEILTDTYGAAQAPLRLQRWRMFFLACSELFACDGGEEWFVSQSLLAPAPEEEAGGGDGWPSSH